MQLIPDTINLRDYIKAPAFAPKIRKASDFKGEVMELLRPTLEGKKYPTLLSPKARGLLEFRPGEVTAYAGYNGHRKSMFTSQVALDLAVQSQKVLIVSLEMEPQATMARMTRQAAGTCTPHAGSIDNFHRWTDERIWLFDHVGRLDVQTMLALSRYFAQELGGQHIFIDSMMMICATEERLDEQKQFVTDLCRLAPETGLHVHLITHCRKPPSGDETRPPSKYDIKGSGAISDQAQNVLMVWSNKDKKDKLEVNPHDLSVINDPDALISCEKQRNGAWEGRLKYWFDDASLRFLESSHAEVAPYHFLSQQR